MNKFTVSDKYTGEQFEHAHKATARKAYNEGKTIAIDSCKMRPFNVWCTTMVVNKNDTEDHCVSDEADFDNLVNSFEYYNCNSETGRRAAFYIKIEEVKPC